MRDWALNACDVNPVSYSQSCCRLCRLKLSPRYRVDVTGYSAQSPIRRVFYFVNRDFDRLLQIEIELKSHSIACFCMFYVSTSQKEGYLLWVIGNLKCKLISESGEKPTFISFQDRIKGTEKASSIHTLFHR